jgi:hypothetical protein
VKKLICAECKREASGNARGWKAFLAEDDQGEDQAFG